MAERSSDAEIFVELVHVRRQFAVGETVDDLAVLHDVIAVGDRRGETEVLLDQQDGEPLSLQLADRVADLLDDDRGEASVGSSSISSVAPVRRMRPIASICCSPPDSFVPWLDRRSFRLGKARRSGRQAGRRASPAAAASGSRARRARRRCRVLPAEGDAEARDPVGGHRDRLGPVEADRTLALADDAHDGLQRRRLAGAVAAEQGHDLALAHVELDAVQDVGFAVPGFEARRPRAAGGSSYQASPTPM